MILRLMLCGLRRGKARFLCAVLRRGGRRGRVHVLPHGDERRTGPRARETRHGAVGGLAV